MTVHPMFVQAKNINQALPIALAALLDNGDELESRNGPMRETVGATIELRHPQQRFLTSPERHANPAAQIAETMWVLAGRNDIAWLRYYLPRASDFSDDGVSWRAGYGPRLRAWPHVPLTQAGVGNPISYPVDQLHNVLTHLQNDLGSRRAVIGIWDPALDYVESKDIPCNDLLQFLIRNDALHMHIHVRSNDAIWGWSGINQFEWSVLQEILAHNLGVRVGPARYFIGSFHLYARHYTRARKIVSAQTFENTTGYPDFGTNLSFAWKADELDKLFTAFFRYEHVIRHDRYFVTERLREAPAAIRPLLQAVDIYSRLHAPAHLRNDYLRDRIRRIDAPDLQRAMQMYLDEHTSPQDDTPLPVVTSRHSAAPSGSWSARLSVDQADLSVMECLVQLQRVKNRRYGESWKQYGEMSAFPNVARKFSRIAPLQQMPNPEELDETLFDTVADLAVYAVLYYGLLQGNERFSPNLVDAIVYAYAHVCADPLARVASHFQSLEAALGYRENMNPSDYNKADAVLAIAAYCIQWMENERRSGTPSWRKYLKMVRTLVAEDEAAESAVEKQA